MRDKEEKEVVRLGRPEKYNPYYNTIANGGYSRAIVGKPTQEGLNVLSNCVGFSYGRYHEIAGRKEMDLFDPVNAEDIYANAIKHGREVSSKPQVGAVIVWEGEGSKAGHVAIVEHIYEDGSILTSESGWNCSNPYWETKRNNLDSNWNGGKGYKFLGFVLQPQIKQTYIRKGDFGPSVRTLQTKLSIAGYLRSSEIDGDFGNITLGAVLAFQFENDLEVDGVAGPLTQKALGMG